MFKKQIGVIVAFGLLCAGIIIYSAVRVLGSTASFETSGYVHTSAVENEDKKILFDSGTSYNKKTSDTIAFYDSVGNDSRVDELNFIHYDDSSISSFVDGALVDLDDLSVDNVAMNHYALPATIVLEKRGTAYAVKDSATGYSFSNFIWKIDANKYLFVSPSMKIHFSDSDERGITNYCEVTYVGNSLIQVQTEDNIWQTISTDCKLFFDNGLYSDLYNKAILDDENNVILDFSRIIINSENNVELSPYVKSNGETTIPHFTVSSESGLDGYGGDPGTNGAPGASGSNGVNGVDGGDGFQGDPGDAGTGVDSEIKDFPVFSILNWKVTKNSIYGEIKIVENVDVEKGEVSLLQPDSAPLVNRIFITDLETGEIILPNGHDSLEATGQWDFLSIVNATSGYPSFSFSPVGHSLKPDHSYMLEIDAVTKTTPESNPYLRPYIIKTFWTDSVGFYGEKYGASLDTVTVNVVKEQDPSSTIYPLVTCYLFDNYRDASLADSDEVNNPEGYNILVHNRISQKTSPSNEQETSITFEDLDRNKKYYVRFEYGDDENHDGSYDGEKGITSQILELSTLKQRASVGTPTLFANSNIYGFDIAPGPLTDVDNSFVSYSYEFYEVEINNDDDSSYSILSDEPVVVGPSSNLNTYSIAIGSSSDYSNVIKRGRRYVVKCVGTFNDNEKTYTLSSDYSNPAMLEQSIKPSVYFKADNTLSGTGKEGVFVNVPEYDTITGFVIVAPGSDGYRLGVRDNYAGAGYEAPILTINKNGYYYLSAPIYKVDNLDNDSADPYTYNKYFKALVLSDGTIQIRLIDAGVVDDNARLAAACGLQPDSDYEISINGTLVLSDGTPVSTNNDVGRCYVHTGPMAAMTATWTTSSESSDKLKEATVKLSKKSESADPEMERAYAYSFNREKESFKEITIDLFSGQVNVDFLRDNSKYPTKSGGLLSSRTLNPETDETLYEALFNGNGLKVDEDFFADGNTTSENFTSDFASASSYTIYVKEAKDGSFEDYSKYQDAYSSIAKPDKNKIVDGNSYYYENEFNYASGLLVNSYKPGTSEDLGACYITEEEKISNIYYETKDRIWTELSYEERATGNYKYNTYLMSGNYTNSTKTAYTISYYVYDSIDFYSSDSFQTVEVTEPGNPDPVQKISYQRQSETTPQIYDFNSDMKGFLSDAHASSIAFDYLTPVHLEGLELAKITIEVQGQPSMPQARFIAMTKQEYADKNGIDVGAVPTMEGNTYLFYIDSISDNPHLTEDDIHPHGHQFVFAWTVNVELPSSGTRMVFPFDATVEKGDKYSDYANPSLSNSRFASIFATCPYVVENSNAVYGKDAYMLIPHSTHTMLSGESDVPRIEPTINAATWDVDGNQATVRAIVYDGDKIIERTQEDQKLAYVNEVYNGDFRRLVNGSFAPITISVTDDVTYANNDNLCFATLMKDDPDQNIVNSISVTDEDKDGLVSASVVAYKYSRRYTNLADKKFGEYPKYVEYIGVNWNMENSYNKENLSLFSNLFETATYTHESIKPSGVMSAAKFEDINLHSFGNMDAYVYWLKNSDGTSDTAAVDVKVSVSDINYVAGFRLIFEYAPHKLQIDKLLPSFDLFNNEGGEDVVTFDYNMDPGYVNIRFKFVVPTELYANIKYPNNNSDGSVRTVDQNGNDVTVQYSSFINEGNDHKPIKVTIKPLIRGGKGGYKYIAKTLDKQSDSIYSYETFGLKVLPDNTKTIINVEDNIRKYEPLYYSFGDRYSYFNGDNHYNTGVYYYPYLGSFYSMRLAAPTGLTSSPKLYVASTRSYFNSSSSYTTNYSLSTRVSEEAKDSFTKYIPTLMEDDIASVNVRTYNLGIYPLRNSKQDIDNYRGSKPGEQGLLSTIEIPNGKPTVEYSNDDKTYESYYLQGKHTSRDDKIYYSVVHENTPEIYYKSGNTVSFYEISDYTGPTDFENEEYKIKINYQQDASGNYVKDSHGARIPLLSHFDLTSSTYRFTSPEFDPTENANSELLSKCLKEVTDIGDDSIDKISIYNLMPSSKYKVICWRYIEDSGNPGSYYFIPVGMYLSGLEMDNYHTIETIAIPQLNYFAVYKADSLTQKRLTVQFTDIRVDGEILSYIPSDYYVVVRLLNEDNSFITFLDCGNYSFGKQFIYDLDNVGDTGDSGIYIPYNWNDLSVSRPSTKASNIMKYGSKYCVQIHVYENDRGPKANGTWNGSYDFDIDEECLFVNVEAGIKNNKPYQFTVNNSLDSMGVVTIEKHPNVSDVSSFTFHIGSITSNSGTLRGHYNQAMLAPYILLTHYNDAGNPEYYDMSGYASEVITPGSSITIPTTMAVEETDGEGHTITTYKDIYQDGDSIMLFLFARQEISLSSSRGPVSPNAYITANSGWLDPLSNGDIMDTGTRGVTPIYGTPSVNITNHVVGTPVSADVFGKLSVVYAGKSRLVATAEKITESSIVSVGNVSIVPLDNDLLIIYRNGSSIEMVKKITVGVTINSKFTVTSGGVISTGTDSQSFPIQEFSVSGSGRTGRFELGDSIANIVKTAQQGFTRDNEQLSSVVYTVQFLDESGTPIQIDLSSEAAGQIVSDSGTTVSYTQIFN